MDSDRPPERWSPLDTVGWFLSLWPALKERLHRWLHNSEPHCPYCARYLAIADEWAEKWRTEEAAHADTASRLRAARVIAQDEKARTDEAERRLEARAEVAPEPPESIALRFPKTEEDVRELLSDCKTIAEDPHWRMSQDDYVKASLGAGVRVSCIDQWGKPIMANQAREAEA